jgi:hypothetical protein
LVIDQGTRNRKHMKYGKYKLISSQLVIVVMCYAMFPLHAPHEVLI